MDYIPAELRNMIEPILRDLGLNYRFKPMFGGILGYVDEKPFASLSNHGIALKCAPAMAAELLGEGGRSLQYEPDSPPSKSYILVPDAFLRGGPGLRAWIERVKGV